MKEILLKDDPDVSVVVPMYNAEKFVAETLDCLLQQTYKNFEVIIVDDGSTDNSKRVCEHFFFDRRIRYIKKENGGTGSALNVGHKVARGKYVTWCSADNVYLPTFIETLRSRLIVAEIQEEGVELVYSDFCFMNDKAQKIHDQIHTKAQTGRDLIEGYDIGMSFLYTKALWDKTGEYWGRICEDYHWVVRAAQHTKFALVNNVLAGFRVHGQQITGSQKDEEKAAADACRALAKELFGVTRTDIAAELSEKLGIL